MPFRFLVILLTIVSYIFCPLPSLAQDKISVCRDGFHRLEGRWKGEKIVASATQPVDSLAITTENCLLKNELLQAIRYEGGIKNDSVRLALSTDGKNMLIQQEPWLISLAVYDEDDIIIVLEQKGKEYGKDCQFRLRYTISNNQYSIKRDARHFGEADFSLREFISLTKIE